MRDLVHDDWTAEMHWEGAASNGYVHENLGSIPRSDFGTDLTDIDPEHSLPLRRCDTNQLCCTMVTARSAHTGRHTEGAQDVLP